MDTNKTPSRLYAAIFYPCMLAAVMLVGVMLFSPDGGIAASSSLIPPVTAQVTAPPAPAVTTVPAPEETRLSLRWSAAQLKNFLQEALGRTELGLRIDAVALQDEGVIHLTGAASRDAIAAMLERRGTAEGSLLRLALRLLPEELAIECAFTIACDAGKLTLAPASFTAGGLELPVTMIPENVCSDFASMAHAALQQQGCTLERLFVSRNMLYLDCNFSVDA